MSERLLHVARADDLEASRGQASYAPAAYASEGFVHLCRPGQLHGVLERHFPPDPTAAPLVLLELDRAGLDAPLEEVAVPAVGTSFPHLHGVIPAGAILRRTLLHRETRPPLARIDVAAGDLRMSDRVHAGHVLRLVSGRLVDEDLRSCLEQLWDHPERHLDRPQLHEYLDVDPGGLTAPGVARLAEARAARLAGRPVHRTAIVASDPLMFGFARMFALRGGGHDDLVAVVDRFDAGFAWIGVDHRDPHGPHEQQRRDRHEYP